MFTPRATATIDKMIKLWRLKSERLGDDGYFDCREDFSVSPVGRFVQVVSVSNVAGLIAPARERQW
jgi:hypothetical protein